MTEKRGRKPTQITPQPEVHLNESALSEDIQKLNDFALLKTSYTGGRDELNQQVGRIQMGLAMSGLTNMMNLQTLKLIKESKSYRSWSGQSGIDRKGVAIADLGTWDGFCRALGVSRDKVEEDIRNMDAFGEEALESLSALGVGYRELRQYRKLPEDRKLALVEIAKSGDKEGFVELAEEIIAKHLKEKETLEASLEEARAENAATSKLLEAKSKRIDQLDREVVRIQNLSPTDDAKELIQAATDTMYSAQGAINGHFRAALQELHDACTVEGKTQLMAGMVNQLIHDLMVLRDQFNLPDTLGDGRPGWMQWAEDQDAQSATIKDGATVLKN